MTVALTARTVTGSTVTVRGLEDDDAARAYASEHGLRVVSLEPEPEPAPDEGTGKRKRKPAPNA